MIRIYLTAIAMVALTSSAALAQASASSVSSGGSNGADASAISGPSVTSSVANLTNVSGAITDSDFARNGLTVSSSTLLDSAATRQIGGFDQDAPEQLINTIREFGEEFGEDFSSFCNFSISEWPNNCPAEQ